MIVRAEISGKTDQILTVGRWSVARSHRHGQLLPLPPAALGLAPGTSCWTQCWTLQSNT
jgi:hypothetical protein